MPSGSEVITLKLKEYGEILGTRGLGEQIREKLLASLRSSTDVRVVLDFEGVGVMTQSFGDELFRKLVGHITPAEVGRLEFRGVSKDVLAVLRYSTSKKEPVEPK